MKMKSVVLAAATAVASSAFAQIFVAGDVYSTWFATNSTQTATIMPGGEFNTPLDSPIAITNTPAKAYDGYAVTAQVSIVVHAELPAVPSQFDNLNPKGAICAAVTNSPSISTNWYGLADGVWVALTVDAPPTETEHILVMEFKDKDCHQVRYSIDGHYCTYNGDDWLESGSYVAPSRVAFAGMGSYKSLTGILVNEKVAPSASAVSWTEGYDFTNGTVSVRLDSYDQASMGDVSLVVKNSAGESVGSAEFGSETLTQSVTPTLTPGETYTYSIVQNAGGVVTTKDVGTFVAAAPGAGFSASVQNGNSVVTNGAWETAAPEVADAKYAISGSEVFNIGEGALEANKLVIVDNRVTFTTWGDEIDLQGQGFGDGTFAAITTVTNGAEDVFWYVFADGGWSKLSGGLTNTLPNTEYDVRAIFDFTSTNVAFSAKPASSSSYVPFTLGGNAWISLVGEPTALREVGYSGIGKLTSVVGGNSDTNIAAVGTTSYATLADAIAAATNGSDTVTLRTNTQWPGAGVAGSYTILTNGFVLAGITTGSGIEETANGYVITLSAGICAVEGGKLNVDEAALRAIIGGSASGKTPEEITAALTAKADNGVEKWVNYVLGINGSDAANKPFAAPVQNDDPSKLTFALGGVGNIPAGTDATVAYEVETSTDGSTWSSGSTAAPGNTVTVDAPNSGVKYYRVKVRITLPD